MFEKRRKTLVKLEKKFESECIFITLEDLKKIKMRGGITRGLDEEKLTELSKVDVRLLFGSNSITTRVIQDDSSRWLILHGSHRMCCLKSTKVSEKMCKTTVKVHVQKVKKDVFNKGWSLAADLDIIRSTTASPLQNFPTEVQQSAIRAFKDSMNQSLSTFNKFDTVRFLVGILTSVFGEKDLETMRNDSKERKKLMGCSVVHGFGKGKDDGFWDQAAVVVLMRTETKKKYLISNFDAFKYRNFIHKTILQASLVDDKKTAFYLQQVLDGKLRKSNLFWKLNELLNRLEPAMAEGVYGISSWDDLCGGENCTLEEEIVRRLQLTVAIVLPYTHSFDQALSFKTVVITSVKGKSHQSNSTSSVIIYGNNVIDNPKYTVQGVFKNLSMAFWVATGEMPTKHFQLSGRVVAMKETFGG